MNKTTKPCGLKLSCSPFSPFYSWKSRKLSFSLEMFSVGTHTTSLVGSVCIVRTEAAMTTATTNWKLPWLRVRCRCLLAISQYVGATAAGDSFSSQQHYHFVNRNHYAKTLSHMQNIDNMPLLRQFVPILSIN